MTALFAAPVGRDRIVSRILAHPLGSEPVGQRAAFARLVLGEVADVAEHAAADLTFEGTDGTIVYFHGGGYIFGSPVTHARIGSGLAQRTGLRVVLAAYPLAPEHRWPAQLEAAIEAVRDATRDISESVVLAGDSAGGHLALVTALELARQGEQVAGLVLFSPNTDRSGLSTTRTRNDPCDPMVNDADDQQMARQCFGEMSVDNPQISPVLDDLALLPPIYVEVGREEVLLGDSLMLACQAREAGVAVTLHVQPDGLHMGQLWAPWWPVAAASLDRAASFAQAAAGGN